MLQIHQGDNLPILRSLPDEHFHLIYIDPPFNTGRRRSAHPTAAISRDAPAPDARPGFGGRAYERRPAEGAVRRTYDDAHDDYLGFLEPRLVEARRVLTPDGSLFFHIDPRESHYCKILLDRLFGRDAFINEIIWAYDYGGRSKTRWPAKHDVILFYAKNPARYTFNYDAIDRIPYLAPGLVTPEKASRGKTPTDVWWNTIVSPTGREKTGYPTQKPLAILRRIIRVHSNPGDHVLDFFAGSGTTGAAAAELGRHATLIDENLDAIAVMRQRLPDADFGRRTPKPVVRSRDGAAQPSARNTA